MMSFIWKISKYSLPFGMLIVLVVMTLNPLPSPTVRAQDPGVPKIESDDPAVVHTGTWSSQTSSQASGGSYLYNAPSPINGDDVALTLQFSGPSVEILYVSGPNLGTMAIEMDGVVLRTVITTNSQTAYQQSATIDYLTDEAHTLRVYAQAGGVIGVDAFNVIALPNAPSLSSQVSAMNGEASSRIPCVPNGLPQLISLDENGNQIQYPGVGLNYWTQYDTTHTYADISADGRYVAFQQIGMFPDKLYVYDRQTCTTSIAPQPAINSWSLDHMAFGSVAISGEGSYVVFTTHNNGQWVIYLYDRPNNVTYPISDVDLYGQTMDGEDVAISGNGRYIIYVSHAFVSQHIVMRDLQTGIETLVSADLPLVFTINSQPDVSADGQLVVFKKVSAGNWGEMDRGNIYLRNLRTQTTSLLSASPNPDDIGGSYEPAISADGRYVAFVSEKQFLVPNDTNGKPDVFVRDLQTGNLARVSIYSDGSQVDADQISSVTISGDGRYVGFTMKKFRTLDSPIYLDVFVHDRQTGQTYVVSRRDIHTLNYGFSYSLAIADYAPVVVFRSSSSTLAPGDLSDDDDTYVNSLILPTTTPVNTDTLALINPTTRQMSLIDTIADPPPPDTYTTFTSNARASGQWVMGDWDGDGDETPGVYEDSGAFMYTNDLGPTASWRGVWFGLLGRPPVVGRFDPNVNHDCVGVVDNALFYGSTGFALYYACNLTGSTTPPLGVQWLGFLLQNSTNFQGDFQFAAGDFDTDGIDTIAVRRGSYVSWTNTIPTTLYALYNFAQYWGASLSANDYGLLVVGDWNNDAWDSFGFMFQNGDFVWRNDLLWNNGGWKLTQHTGLPVGSPVQAASWH